MEATLDRLVATELLKLHIIEQALRDPCEWEFEWSGQRISAHPFFEVDRVVFIGTIHPSGSGPISLLHRGEMKFVRPVEISEAPCAVEWEVAIGQERRPAA